MLGSAAAAGARADLFPGRVEDLVDGLLRDIMCRDLRIGKDGFEVADEVRRADDLFAEVRRSSTVPASTIETYMMALRGEYCIAIFVAPVSRVWSCDSSSCQEE